MKTAIYGAGSLGTVLGAYLARSGVQVDLISRNEAHIAALRSTGAHVTGWDDFSVPVSAYMPCEMPAGYDVIVLMTKCIDNAETVRFLKDKLSPDGIICTCQNGLPEAEIAAIIGMRLRQKCNESGLNGYMGIAISAFVATMVAWATTFLPASWTDTPWHPLLACALFIVPGVPLINFVDDMLDNYIQVGIVRAANTMIMMGAMAFGIAFAVKLCAIENFFPTISMIPHHSYWEYALAAAISAMGFSMIFNIQRRLLWVVAIGGILAVCTRNFVNLGPSTNNIGLDMGLVVGSFLGALLVSLIAVKAVHWFHVPNHVLTIPSVIPMIPGVLMYRMLFGIINMNVQNPDGVTPLMKAIESGVNSGLIILCISVGVAIPNIFGRKYIASSKNKRLAELLKERRERGKFVEW